MVTNADNGDPSRDSARWSSLPRSVRPRFTIATKHRPLYQ